MEDLFDGLFAHLARGTVAEGAELEITRMPITVRCQECGFVYHLDVRNKETFACPTCHASNYKLNSGMEFYISGIDIVRKGDSDD